MFVSESAICDACAWESRFPVPKPDILRALSHSIN